MPKFAFDILKEVEMEDEFKEIVEKYAEKEPTPMEMDLKVRMDRVMYVLNRALATIRVVMYLPAFLEHDGELLKKYLTRQETFFIFKLMNKYGSTFDLKEYRKDNFSDYSDVLENININRMPNKYGKHITSQYSFSNPQVSNMIDILFNNKCIRQFVRDAGRKGVDKSVAGFLNTMEDLKKVAKEMIYQTGEEEDAKDKELRQAYKHNVLVVASIKELEARLEHQRRDLGVQLEKKVQVFTLYNKKKEKIRADFEKEIENYLTESEKEMMNRTVISEGKQLNLAEQAKRMTKEYEEILDDHLATEKVSRSKRLKAETQLHNWLIKYDQDIGERQTEYETAKAKFDEEKEEMEALQDLFEDQEEEYEYLMKERDEEEKSLRDELAFKLLQSRSARIIQRAWRAYVERKKARRKGKKGKGKGKDGKGKGKAKKENPPEKGEEHSRRAEDPNALLAKNKKFKAEVFDEIQDKNAFDKKDVQVDLAN